jgi:SAM-dependent methyltransferase
MSGGPTDDPVAEALLAQKEFYDQRAPDYMDPARPLDRKAWGGIAPEDARDLIYRLGPVGHTVEIAAGTGQFTRWLVGQSESVTALDSSPAMLERNRCEVDDPRMVYVEADVFDWVPEHRYDLVLFGMWLSHVPSPAFERFWEKVRSCLAPGGRVVFVDEDHRASGVVDDPRLVEGVPVVRRVLADGREYDVMKVLWNVEELEDRLGRLGWNIRVARLGDMLLYGDSRG